jgi:16S rRNA (guanine1207-N2)-methyltransferase
MSAADPAADVLLGALPPLPEGGAVLIIGEPGAEVTEGLRALGLAPVRWDRRAGPDREAAVWPAPGPYAAAILRLPRDRPSLEMALHAAASELQPDGLVLVYGANDEGIKSASRPLEALFSSVEALDARRHCRVWAARGLRGDAPLRVGVDAWAQRHRLLLPAGKGCEVEAEQLSFPGVFAKGQLDPASAALLQVLPKPAAGAHVLDYGCGAGVLARGLLARQPQLELQLIDVDAPSALAARRNLPAAKVTCGDGWSALPRHKRYDLIVSNPPYHDGNDRDHKVVERLIQGAPHRLAPGGSLWIVAQRQVPVSTLMEAHFDDVTVRWEDGRFRVWRAGRLEDGLGA